MERKTKTAQKSSKARSNYDGIVDAYLEAMTWTDYRGVKFKWYETNLESLVLALGFTDALRCEQEHPVCIEERITRDADGGIAKREFKLYPASAGLDTEAKRSEWAFADVDVSDGVEVWRYADAGSEEYADALTRFIAQAVDEKIARDAGVR